MAFEIHLEQCRIMARFLFLSLSIIFSLIACKRISSLASDDKTAITKKVYDLYIQYGKSNESIYNKPISQELFSPDLKNILENAVRASKADIERVKKSDHPDEKPLIFEGAIFSSLYEGYSGYQIQSITVKDKTAEAAVRFEYNMTSPKVLWTDKIHLVKHEHEWKIDNITFDRIGSSKDLKTQMTEFVKSAHE